MSTQTAADVLPHLYLNMPVLCPCRPELKPIEKEAEVVLR